MRLVRVYMGTDILPVPCGSLRHSFRRPEGDILPGSDPEAELPDPALIQTKNEHLYYGNSMHWDKKTYAHHPPDPVTGGEAMGTDKLYKKSNRNSVRDRLFMQHTKRFIDSVNHLRKSG